MSRDRFVRWGRVLVKSAAVFSLAVLALLAYRHAALAATPSQTPEQLAAVAEIVATLGGFAALVLSTIGITGGLRQLFDGLPDFKLGRIVIKDGVWMSFIVGAAVTLAAYATGRLDFALTGDGVTDLRNMWLLVTAASNYVYRQVYGDAPA